MTSAGRGARLGRNVRAGRSVVVHNHVTAEVIQLPTTTTAYANNMTNAILHSRAIAVDPSSGDVVHIFYRQSDLQVVLSRQTAGVGAFVETVGTASIVDAADDHCSIKAIYDDQGILCVWLGSHSDQERYYELPVGVTLIAEARRVTPRVPGGAALEAQATYHDPVRLNDGAIAVLWRSGGSGNGDHYLDVKRAGVWTRKPKVLDGTSDTLSFYTNTLAVGGVSSPYPNRLSISFQCRFSSDAATAAGLWLIDSDTEGSSWTKWKTRASLPAGARFSQLSGAEVENIPDAYTDPTYSYYYGLQGMCVDSFGCPVITMYYGPATAAVPGSPNGYGTPTGPITVWAWRCDTATGLVLKRAIRTFGETQVIGLSRPTPLARAGSIYVFYSKKLNTDPAGTGRMCCVEAVGPSLSAAEETDVFGRNIPIDVKDADFVFDRNLWADGAGRLLWRGMKVGASGTTTSNTPFVAEITIQGAAPTLKAPPEIFGSTVLDWAFDPDHVTLDGSSNIQASTDQSGNGSSRDFAQATAGNRPSVAVYDGHNAARFDGSNDYLAIAAGLSRSAPSTGNKFRLWGIFSMQAWVSGDRMCDVNGALIFQSPSGTSVRINHGSSVLTTAGLSAGLTRKVSALFTASTGDQLQVDDGTVSTGASAGSTISGTQVVIGAGSGGALPSQIDCHYMFALRRDWTAWEKWQLDNYALLRLPSNLI